MGLHVRIRAQTGSQGGAGLITDTESDEPSEKRGGIPGGGARKEGMQ
jgi:hypothetical protein